MAACWWRHQPITIADYLAIRALQAFLTCLRAWHELDKIFSDLLLISMGKGCVHCRIVGTLLIRMAATQQARLEQSSALATTGYQFHLSSVLFFLESLRDQATCKWGMKRGSMILLKVHTCVKHLFLSLQHWHLEL